MMDTDKMSAVEFGKWLLCQHGIDAMAIISRDAYRERQALEAAVERHKTACTEHGADPYTWERAAILGTPAFERGQLVRGPSGALYTYNPGSGGPWTIENYEPVLDRDGRPVYLKVED